MVKKNEPLDGTEYTRWVYRSMLFGSDGETPNDVQNPIQIDGDSVYTKDIWVAESDTTNWIDQDNTGEELVFIPFNNLHTAICNTTGNPKTLRVHFNRTIYSSQLALGVAAHPGKTFSNVVIKLLGSGGTIRDTVDDSNNNTKYTSREYPFEPQLFNAIDLEFHTDDEVCITNCTIQKSTNVNAFIQAQKPDDTIANIQATTGGNLKVSIEEYDDAANPIRKDLEGGGKVLVGTTPIEVTFIGTPTHAIKISADDDNTGKLFIGKSNVLSDGSNAFAFLLPGDVLTIDYDDIDNAIYVVSDTVGQNFWKGALL